MITNHPKSGFNFLDKLSQYFPIVTWGMEYQRAYFLGDMTAGIIVASLLIPQGMAYAMLAGLPPQVGLYASIVPQIIYAFLGTSRMLSVAPVAVDSLMVAATVSVLAKENTPEYLGLALTLALLVGVMEILMGFFRLGFLVNFLSQAVISGFISAAAIIIGCSQVKHLFGLQIPQTESFLQLLGYLGEKIGTTNWITLGLGVASLAVLLYFKHGLGKQLKNWGLQEETIAPITKSGPLVVVAGSTLLVWLLHLDKIAAVKIVGDIPKGLPPLSFPLIDQNTLQSLLPAALAISFVGFMEAFAVGKFLASKKRQKVEANQELIALGAANFSAAFTGGYPITGGLSRSVVNFSAGANTGLASIITAIIIAVTVMFFTPLFYFLPQTSLAAIILVAVANLLDFATLKRLWGYDKTDAIAWVAAFIAVLLTSVEKGIMMGAAISLLLHLWRTSKPHIAIVGRVGETEHFRNVRRHEVKTCPHVLAVRVDESLYFVNAKYLQDYILKYLANHPDVKHLVLVCSAVNMIDGSALETLQSLITDLNPMGVEFYLSEVKGPVLDKLEKVGFVAALGRERIFLSTDMAMSQLECR
ncbi:MAG TPA: solute carrier family 26 protein [Oscillatoriaceae cyanobacterium M33_DOE_052]|uniref:Solute carrier 26 family protein n=1 Tax=Planktothricoides sp. SpSt-374 TaxID=2282167 RepID=A0A7C3VFV3_9CYAN|nr:solute carrier family 26 protein [Oscillatoriaceae cyanobacterium M33_DOE_052]